MDAQRTSLTRYVVGPSAYGVHPLGTATTALIRLVTAHGEFATYYLRNVVAGTQSGDLAGALVGVLMPSGATPDSIRVEVRDLPRARGT